MPFFTFALGTWQLKRLKWKVNLIDELEEKLHLEPLTLPKRIKYETKSFDTSLAGIHLPLSLSVLPEFLWRKVKVSGRWDHAHTMILSPRVREGVHGVHVVCPLVRSDGTTVLVDRGFVSNAHIDEFRALSRQEEGEVEILGMLRDSQPRNSFTPDNKPDTGEWFWTDVDAMAAFAGGEDSNVQPVFLEQVFEGHAGEAASRLTSGIPIGRPPTVTLRNAHLSYVITWYMLSGLTTFMFARLVVNKTRFSGRRLPRF
ncbi:hypothetical protein ONZ45_g1357 [Pleurotus djamor]|nr:hypothetical protein ONZ45_g1357 [Pleurotus djamor]